MNEQKSQKTTPSPQSDAKAERLRAALRANLNKRKVQKRARKTSDDSGKGK